MLILIASLAVLGHGKGDNSFEFAGAIICDLPEFFVHLIRIVHAIKRV